LAGKAGKNRRYLETPESQIRTLADLPVAAQVRFLTSTVQEIADGAAKVDEMDAAWAAGDSKKLEQLLTKDISDAGPDVYAAVLTRRNAHWTGQIDEMMRGKGKIFIAVGAAHLVGKDGVPAMLRARGYVVEGP